ncbi:MAG: MotA/TolQ/ExbB proton channel family protein [Sporomusaceae bacterium]|nr:MotA/TolQ/ExbB proton channel family protein [Sporomusaceae bacterium]
MDFLQESIALFHKGGPVMYALLLSSFFVVAVGIERFYYYRQASIPFSTFKEKLEPLLQRKMISEAQTFCQNGSNVVAVVAGAGIEAFQQGRNAEKAMESAATFMAAKLRERLNYVSTVVTLAPLMGLLGTVVGMINSFSVFNVAQGEPGAITGGVGEALVATASGLCIAILALMIYTYFSQRLDSLVTDIEQTVALVMSRLPHGRTERGEFHEIA